MLLMDMHFFLNISGSFVAFDIIHKCNRVYKETALFSEEA